MHWLVRVFGIQNLKKNMNVQIETLNTCGSIKV
jgi:hypothetical protein